MIYRVVFLFSFILLFSCKSKVESTTEVKTFYPKTINYTPGGYLFHDLDHDLLFERNGSVDSLNATYMFDFGKDSLVVNRKKLAPPTFYKSFLSLDHVNYVLETKPRTLGKNNKSTDILTKYSKDFQVELKKDMTVSKYPSGNGIVIGDKNRLFYITDGFKHKENRKLVVSELNDALEIINKKTIDREESNKLYNPLECILIENEGLVIISNLSKQSAGIDKKHRLEMFDFDLNVVWSHDLYADAIISLELSKSEKRICLVKNQGGCHVSYWDYNGNKIGNNFSTESSVVSVATSDKNIFLLDSSSENKLVTKLDFAGNKMADLDIPYKIEITEKKTSELVYRQNQLFIVEIDNSQSKLLVNRIDVK